MTKGVPVSRVHFQVPYSLEFLVGCLEKLPRIFSQMLGFTVMNPMVEAATKSPSTNLETVKFGRGIPQLKD